MTIAQTAYEQFTSARAEFRWSDMDDDRYGSWFDDWREAWLAEVFAVGIDCPESFDSTEVWTFDDGSSLRVCNPRQCAFRAMVSVEEN